MQLGRSKTHFNFIGERGTSRKRMQLKKNQVMNSAPAVHIDACKETRTKGGLPSPPPPSSQ